MNPIIILLGFIILIAGYQLPWIFVAAVGFVSGLFLGELPILELSGVKLVTFALGIAVISGLLVIYFRRFMVALAGFISGAYVCYFLPESLKWNISWNSWPVILLAGAICAVVILLWYSLPAIIVSSLIGATLVIQYIQFQRINEIVLFFVFLFFGITAQWVLMQYGRSEKE